MEKRSMGFKKKFYTTDFRNYILMMFLFAFIIINSIPILVFTLLEGFHFIFNGSFSGDIPGLRSSLQLVLVYILILFLLRKFFYYERLKYNMNEKYNFCVSPDEIEVLFEKGSVKIDVKDIEEIRIFTYSSPLRGFYQVISSIGSIGLFRVVNSANAIEPDSNFAKKLTSIELKIKDSVDPLKYKNDNAYYGTYNYKKSSKTGNLSIFLYEIMYNETSQEDMKYFCELYKDLLAEDSKHAKDYETKKIPVKNKGSVHEDGEYTYYLDQDSKNKQ